MASLRQLSVLYKADRITAGKTTPASRPPCFEWLIRGSFVSADERQPDRGGPPVYGSLGSSLSRDNAGELAALQAEELIQQYPLRHRADVVRQEAIRQLEERLGRASELT
jgi:hypothetical protein